uniref:CoA transferase n=1 Tax=Alexandrium monilatum TaxID=311494 RepID=A0A7S4VCK5_9DINO|mmetsp:Transcript_14589/g.43566  ORF Transcript_14589/g.43566 Transcript_14589/m.43566 type:complete len:426 (-) Transcript_14589:64-1341(-)
MALAGVRVLDFSRFQNGPFATCLLADIGADVVKVEQPGLGDTGRSFISHHSGFCGYNESLNRGKRSIELDLKSPAARPALERLIQWADVLVENYKVGVLDRLGLGYEDCKRINPRLIYCANSGFGPEGPWALRGSFDVVCQGMSGAAMAQGGGPSHMPRFTEWGAADQVGALNFAFHIASALYAREKTGVGQKLECSQLGAMLQFQAISCVPSFFSGDQRDDGRPTNADNVNLSYYPCGDGKWLTCAPCMEDHFWPKFCKALGLEELMTDERTKHQGRRWKNPGYFRERIEARLKEKPRDYWIERIIEVGVPVGPVLDYQEIATHPQMLANNYVTEVENQYGRFKTVGVMARYSGTPAPPVGTAPDLGEHTEEVLRDICGMSDADVKALAAAHATTPDRAKGYREPHWIKVHKWKAHVAEKRSRL